MRNFVVYTAARALLFAVAFGVVYLLGARGLLAAVLALLISGLVSFVLLSRQRDALSASLVAGMGRIRSLGERLEAGAAKEDELQEAQDGARAPGQADRGAGQHR